MVMFRKNEDEYAHDSNHEHIRLGLELQKLNAEEAQVIKDLLERKGELELRVLELEITERHNVREYSLKAFVLISICLVFGITAFVHVFSSFMGDKANSIRAGTEPIFSNTLPIVTMIAGYFYSKKEDKSNK